MYELDAALKSDAGRAPGRECPRSRGLEIAHQLVRGLPRLGRFDTRNLGITIV